MEEQMNASFAWAKGGGSVGEEGGRSLAIV